MLESDPWWELLGSIPGAEGEAIPYAEAREFSRLLDLKLGIRVLETEARILAEHPATPWAGLDSETLQTPYPELRRMLRMLAPEPGSRIVDIGAGYGRMGLMVARFYPGVEFVGIEVSRERFVEGRRMLEGRPRIHWIHGDVTASGFEFPEADHYFLYDFSGIEPLYRVLDRLKAVARKRPLSVIGRGRRTRDQIERNEPWLSGVIPPEHHGTFSLYRTGS
jgi:hypothetical protein